MTPYVRMFLVLVAVGSVACGEDDDASAAVGDTSAEPAELDGVTLAHNEVRAQVGLAPLAWDEDLAAIAQGWANTCQFAHNSGRSDTYPEYVGENIYMSGGFVPSGADVVDAWASEVADYDYAANRCSGVCGHYTQIVWEETSKVGCGIAECGRGNIVVCNYAPGGNINGRRPY